MNVLEPGAVVETGEPRSVIVQMAAPDGPGELARQATEALAQRTLALSARTCLPPDRAPDETTTIATPRPLLHADAESLQGSLLAHAEVVEAPSLDEQRDQVAQQLEPLVAHREVKRALHEAGVDSGEAVESLWMAGALAVDLSPDQQRTLLEDVPGIQAIYPNRMLRVPPVGEVLDVPEDVRETRSSSWGLKTINALAAWGAHGARGQGARVAVLDTGIDATHPDLARKLAGWAEFDDRGRQVNSNPHDGDRHGTHVSGTIVGGNTSGQWIGVAPDAEVVVGKVLGPQGGTDAQILAGMSWAIQQQVDVISMSLGGLTLGPEMLPTYTQMIVQALRQGIPVVTAVGNAGSQTSGPPGNDLFALAVGATDYRDRPAGFSGGRTQIVRQSQFIDPKYLPLPYSKPDISAPGVAVVSSVPGGMWKALNGTSMATPHVAGAMALLLSATKIRTNVRPAERAFVLSDILTGSVEELGEAGQDHRYGFGRIDALRAIDFAHERGY